MIAEGIVLRSPEEISEGMKEHLKKFRKLDIPGGIHGRIPDATSGVITKENPEGAMKGTREVTPGEVL